MRKVNTKIIPGTERSKDVHKVYYSEMPNNSESVFGFERIQEQYRSARTHMYVASSGQITSNVLKTGFTLTDYLFDYPFKQLGRLMLIRDSFRMLRVIGWSLNGLERYKLYTKDFDIFANTIFNLSAQRIRPTEYVWAGGDIVNVVGPDIIPVDTPSTTDFEHKVINNIQTLFTDAHEANIYGERASELLNCKSNIETYLLALSRARQAFIYTIPSQSHFE